MTSRSAHARPPGGVYVHIPFCIRKCPYCDFYSTTDLSLVPAFLDALEREIRTAAVADLEFDSLYLGGGTPSVLTPGQVRRILAGLFGVFAFGTDVEANVEVNPGTVDLDKLAAYRAAGLNRVTVGVQSFSDRNLGFLGRIHSAAEAGHAVRWARAAGFDHIGLDLIYGLPGQTREDWIEDMRAAVGLQPEHLSCYLLTVEPSTPLHREVLCGRVAPVGDQTAAALFETTVEFLAERGYRQYEVSNFARAAGDGDTANRSRHNRKYWNFSPYLGFGPGAHSFVEPRRFWNHRSLGRYLEDVAAGRLPTADAEDLSRGQMMMEAVFLGLRQNDGIDLAAFRCKFGIDLVERCAEQLKELTGAGRAQLGADRLSLTSAGMLVLDSICGELIQALDN